MKVLITDLRSILLLNKEQAIDCWRAVKHFFIHKKQAIHKKTAKLAHWRFSCSAANQMRAALAIKLLALQQLLLACCA
jgi:hypothetical protein